MLDHATSEIASGSKLGIDATKKLPGEGGKTFQPVAADVPLISFLEWPLSFDQKTTTKLLSGRAKAVAWLDGGTPGASPFAQMGWSSAP